MTEEYFEVRNNRPCESCAEECWFPLGGIPDCDRYREWKWKMLVHEMFDDDTDPTHT